MITWEAWTEVIQTGERLGERELSNDGFLLEVEACLAYKWWSIHAEFGLIVLESSGDETHRWCYQPITTPVIK